MPVHEEIRILPYSPEQMFDLVADVARYPEFLPWVIAARELRRNRGEDRGDAVTYEMTVGFKMVRQRFVSKAVFDRPGDIAVDYISGPMRRLTNSWKFLPHGDGGCEIDFHIEFEFHSRILEKLIGALFYEAVTRMVHAFETRARAVYGEAGEAGAVVGTG